MVYMTSLSWEISLFSHGTNINQPIITKKNCSVNLAIINFWIQDNGITEKQKNLRQFSAFLEDKSADCE